MAARSPLDDGSGSYSYYDSFYSDEEGGTLQDGGARSQPRAARGGSKTKSNTAAPADVARSNSIRARLVQVKAAANDDSSSSGMGGEPTERLEYNRDELYELYPQNPKLYRKMGKLLGVANALGTDLHRGIDVSTIPSRRERFGANRLPEAPTKSFLELCYETLQDFILILLIVAAIVSLILGVTVASHDGAAGWIEGAAILVAVTLVVMVTALNDYKKEQQFQKLNKQKDDKSVKVLRSGSESAQSISVFDVVVGDLLQLSTGDIVPVDGLYVSGNSCAADESGQTGEPDLCHKNKHNPFFISGSKIKEGDAVMLVTCVGMDSHNGRAVMALRVPPEDTPLQKQLDKLAKDIGKLGMFAAVILFIVLSVKFFIMQVDKGKKIDNEALELMTEYIITSITIVVVAVPEGLPLAVTIALAYSMVKMLKDQNLVRKLAACETMGRATVICSDKTGTLTRNEMTVVDGWIAGESLAGIDSADDALLAKKVKDWSVGPKAEGVEGTLLFKILQGININSSAAEVSVESKEGGGSKLEWTGSTTEQALLKFTRQVRGSLPDYRAMREEADSSGSKVKAFPFSSKRKRSSYVVRLSNGMYRHYVKGASEMVLAECVSYLDASGNVRRLTPEIRSELEAKIGNMAQHALRTICLAYKDLAMPPADNWDEEDISESVVIGITGIHDVIRPEVPQSVLDCQKAGIVVRMVTGDNIDTARAIAVECNIYDPDLDTALEGPDFAKCTNAELKHILPAMTVLARSAPLDKQRLVERLQVDFDEVVAVTGDGTNDGPALSKADVGFGMGVTGTEVAKEAADIILMDDKFTSIVAAVLWGRNVYDSIRKFLQFQLTVNVVAVALAFIGAVSNDKGESPLKAVQLLWVNLIMDTLAALALATEEPSEGLLDRMPTRNEDRLVSLVMWMHIIGQSIFQLIVTLVLLYDGHNIFNVEQYETEHFTIIFNAFVWCQLFNEFNTRRIHQEINCFENIFANWLFGAIWVATALMQVFIVEAAGDWAQVTGLGVGAWFGSLLVGLISLPIGFLLRLVPMHAPEYTRENVNADRVAAGERRMAARAAGAMH
ncbi:calcium-transporting ATPase PAT1 [Thecamonas trahens ATCC 50062]|uniref:Calcium-transporting ATPase n=1 Tax=Thecamonas trahens ATCC 50062 TaxID=461836 RepID=A0A0L0DFF4_THETB|nr:calcium-transporting ATPase PAT1 [Thecamonas trahens ATCC 50062]KNC50881.1 calcium-transporting ATPase PAT1 [Thecamonas trahens ATCC 50062]|eukprot:XP_013756588.1 calcium-transporting ATPase PAT1 [Thecamonas trahens ATCC 50062]